MVRSRRTDVCAAHAAWPQRGLWALAWGLAVAAMLHFLWTTYWKYAPQDAAAYGMFWTRRAWLWTHVGGGVVTALLGPMQFVGRLRRAYPRLHRWTGRAYLCAMLVACVGAGGLIATSLGGRAFQIAFAATALAWLVTALKGYTAIRQGRMQVHRRWMIRNYIVTLAPVAFRLTLQVPGVMALAHPAVLIPTLLWLSWALSLLVYELGAAATRCMRRAPVPQGEPA